MDKILCLFNVIELIPNNDMDKIQKQTYPLLPNSTHPPTAMYNVSLLGRISQGYGKGLQRSIIQVLLNEYGNMTSNIICLYWNPTKNPLSGYSHSTVSLIDLRSSLTYNLDNLKLNLSTRLIGGDKLITDIVALLITGSVTKDCSESICVPGENKEIKLEH